MGDAPLVMSGATKRFGGFTAVSNLSFEVPEGQIIGFLGPNGAGKSTSLRMALGVMAPDEGEVALFGLRRVGFLPEERGLYKKMTARDTITYFARLKGMSADAARIRANELLETTGLGKFKASRISKLSKGMAQKVQILSTLAHRPDFLILDEPFSGLDPMNQQTLEDLIRAEHKRGATILFSTHVMEHAERLCDRIVMLARGRKVFDGTLDAAYATLGQGARMAVEHGFDLAAALGPKGFEAHRAACLARGAGDRRADCRFPAGRSAPARCVRVAGRRSGGGNT
jgi:ABC-2 type transport system ATP-binding protein